jgi:hypothetical protein
VTELTSHFDKSELNETADSNAVYKAEGVIVKNYKN